MTPNRTGRQPKEDRRGKGKVRKRLQGYITVGGKKSDRLEDQVDFVVPGPALRYLVDDCHDVHGLDIPAWRRG